MEKIKTDKVSRVPDMVFKTRVRDESIEGDNPYRWQDVSTAEIFHGRRVLVFSLPGAFTPTCSTYQLPDFDKLHQKFKRFHGIQDIYCVSVNDSFVMNAWAKAQGVQNVKMLPDGSAQFTHGMQMLVEKDNLGFGRRSWRYAAVIDDGNVLHWFEEPGKEDNCESDPYEVTSPQSILAYLESL